MKIGNIEINIKKTKRALAINGYREKLQIGWKITLKGNEEVPGVANVLRSLIVKKIHKPGEATSWWDINSLPYDFDNENKIYSKEIYVYIDFSKKSISKDIEKKIYEALEELKNEYQFYEEWDKEE